MQNSLTLNPISFINGTVHLPGSKSISNRVLLLSAISKGTTYLHNLLFSDDTKYMLNTLRIFGINIVLSNNNTVCRIKGQAKPLYIEKKTSLFLGNAGTAMRPLSAILSLSNNDILLTGDDRMKERPIKHLVNALRQGGANIKYSETNNYPPIHIQGGFSGGNITINGSISSQFLTALLIASPLAIIDSKITIKGNLVSKPYIDMTLKLISQFGINIINDSYNCFYIKGRQQYQSPGDYFIEGDASSASYFLAAAAIKGGSVCVTGIGENSIQGDVKFSSILKKMGAFITVGNNFICCKKGTLYGIDLDMNDIPDAAMTVAMVALFSIGETIIRNIYNWRVKETDRLSAMSAELRKIGAIVNEGNDFIHIIPPKKFFYANINTYNDHRIAMCFSLIALSNVKVTLLNPNCVNKTFPHYFKELHCISF
ncbi:3-phosphoshikimate 1-carboxyvinyltransferase [Buchnera aphidicola]|uniref:3-phosphoshikimate 1-carboxyvinyltransferase n=1 Tax=Buchnera aphidicola subsp. Melaphis rhois TaxID=118103 RepID=A0A4D6Y3Y7_BUCMH|nr:3-phosphoshikimate 1-carboxyvinyltransferase [Buchnera aphidicola]QCI23313.1 3-phosphoshikimate 1-carboxyvinyltransferase [Buchnera aphidicola (Melaphis rhois)]